VDNRTGLRPRRTRLAAVAVLSGAGHTTPYWGANQVEQVVGRVTLAGSITGDQMMPWCEA
jgi:hypothetical protein